MSPDNEKRLLKVIADFKIKKNYNFPNNLKEQTNFKEDIDKLNSNSTSKNDVWEQRRYEIAKDIMSAFVLSTKQSFYCHYNDDGEIENKTPYSIAKEAVYYADCLISVLSEK